MARRRSRSPRAPLLPPHQPCAEARSAALRKPSRPPACPQPRRQLPQSPLTRPFCSCKVTCPSPAWQPTGPRRQPSACSWTPSAASSSPGVSKSASSCLATTKQVRGSAPAGWQHPQAKGMYPGGQSVVQDAASEHPWPPPWGRWPSCGLWAPVGERQGQGQALPADPLPLGLARPAWSRLR